MCTAKTGTLQYKPKFVKLVSKARASTRPQMRVKRQIVSAMVQGAIRGLRTPCIQAFLHMLPALGLLWALVEVAPLTAGLARGAAPSAAVSALQVHVWHQPSSACISLTGEVCMGDCFHLELKDVSCPTWQGSDEAPVGA